jgi:glutamyl-tRNA synthetase
MSVRVRFAPSPTGNVHIGNIRAAIFNWLFARHAGGHFLLRIEDTDRERSTPEAVQAVLDALAWLDLNFDEPPLYQSTQKHIHLQAAETLVAKGLAYKEDKGGKGQGECILFRMPGTDMAFHDEIKGDLRKEAKDLKDFVIVRSDGSPVFHLGNVVDDITQGITHIIRGDDHVENTFRHVALFQALGATVPHYAHLPMIVNAQGKPYSKRDGAAYIGDFREKGFHPGALFNYLSLLGWSPGEDREKMTRAEAVEWFTLDRVKSGPAQMDLKKLTHLNQQYLTEMAPDAFFDTVAPILKRTSWGGKADPAYVRQVSALMQSRAQTFSAAETWKYFFVEFPDYDDNAVSMHLKKAAIPPLLRALRSTVAANDFNAAELHQAVRGVEATGGLAEGKLNQPLRVALTGTTIGAGIFETMLLLGRDRSLARLDLALNRFCAG